MDLPMCLEISLAVDSIHGSDIAGYYHLLVSRTHQETPNK
jgi:hypothetical protein